MSTAKENFELAQQRYTATFERHLNNGVEFISRDCLHRPRSGDCPGSHHPARLHPAGQHRHRRRLRHRSHTLLEDTVVEEGSTINASQCYQSHIGPNNKIGPFTHVRTGTKTAEGCHLGAYVETKNADFAEGNTVSHLTYIGDATVGKYCNFGCGPSPATTTARANSTPPSATTSSSDATPTWWRRSRWATMPSRPLVPPSARMCPPGAGHRTGQAGQHRRLGRTQAGKVHCQKAEAGGRQTKGLMRYDVRLAHHPRLCGGAVPL